MLHVDVFRADEDEVQRQYEAFQLQTEQRRQLRLQLWRNGYEPIPTTGKEVYIRGWQTNPVDEARINYEIRNTPTIRTLAFGRAGWSA